VIDPPAHPRRGNPLPEAPTQAPRKANKQGELKGNQKQKYQPKDQNFKQTQNNTNKHHKKARLDHYCQLPLNNLEAEVQWGKVRKRGLGNSLRVIVVLMSIGLGLLRGLGPLLRVG